MRRGAPGLAAVTLALLAGCSGGQQTTGAQAPTSPAVTSSAASTPSVPTPSTPAMGSTGEAMRAVGEAFAATKEAGSSKVSLTTEVAAQSGGQQDASFTADGVADYRSGDTSLTLRLPGVGVLETRVVDRVVYSELPPQARQALPKGKRWVEVDPKDLKAAGMGGSALSSPSSDPTGLLAFVSAVDEVREVGREPVRGESTTHYTGVVDVKKLAEAQGKDKAGELDQFGERAPVEVWVDDAKRVRRLRLELTTSAPGQASGAGPREVTVNVVQELYDFGTPVDVSAPPKKQTLGVEELNKLAGRA